MAGRRHMKLSHIAIGVLMVAAFSLVGCAGPVRSTETYPTPMPLDLPVGIDEGLITPGWDGSFPLRLLSFIVLSLGVGLGLIVQQLMYLLVSSAREFVCRVYLDWFSRDTAV